jgi:hypothetical protein
MEGSPTFEELEEMTEAKRRKSREENDRRRLEERAEERKRAEEARNSSDPFSPSFDPDDTDPTPIDNVSGSDDDGDDEVPH